VAFINLTNLFGSVGAAAFQQQILSSYEEPSSESSQSGSSDVIQGYKTIFKILANDFMNANGPQVEILFNLMGSGSIIIQAALQHPFSVGRLWIQSPDPFEEVLIDPGYLSHFAGMLSRTVHPLHLIHLLLDIIILRQAIKFIRGLGQILASNLTGVPLIGEELSPGPGVVTDQDIEAWLRNGASSQFHPSSSCGMMPRDQGGVVDSKLRVYGAGTGFFLF
jgi:choline dehydrogenase-like flavoprotein